MLFKDFNLLGGLVGVDGDQADLPAAERAVLERLLPVLGRLQHFIAHAAQGKLDIEARR